MTEKDNSAAQNSQARQRKGNYNRRNFPEDEKSQVSEGNLQPLLEGSPKEVVSCMHHWVLPPKDGLVLGECKKCHEVREFDPYKNNPMRLPPLDTIIPPDRNSGSLE